MRIIAGEKRGCTIDAPKGRETRPTYDKVRESLFGIIQFEVFGRTVLDLFAGSGSLGLEALSRGAAFAAFADSSRFSIDAVRKNIAKLGFEDKSAVYPMDYLRAINASSVPGRKFDLVFLDPPYRAGLVEPAMRSLMSADALKDEFLLVAEHSASIPLEPVEGYALRDTRRYGDTALSFFVREVHS